ncbi:hypothetical protein ES706_04329 [subsurface metagenome]
MGWLPLIFVAVFLGIWFWNVWKRRIARQKRQLLIEARITGVTALVEPIVKEAYGQLTQDIRTRWPQIPFDFPRTETLLTNSRGILKDYPRKDIKRLAKRVLDSIASKAVSDFIAYRPDFLSSQTEVPSDAPVKFHSHEYESKTTLNSPTPSDWPKRRKLIHERDKGCCRRCGTIVPLEKCHIHHIVSRSKGGGHTPDNLITLCYDCHSLMPEHDKVTGGPFYVLPNRYTLHTRECYHGILARRLSGSLPVLLAKGYTPCEKCMPMVGHRTFWIECYIRRKLSSIVNALNFENRKK